MTIAYIGVGSNLGSREANIEKAKEFLKKRNRIFFCRSAPVYETEPVGGPPQGKFLNTVWEVETDLSAEKLLEALAEIEKALGRTREVENGPRTLDLDLLFFGNQIQNFDSPAAKKDFQLMLPHPKLHERWFVLKPLSDLSPELMHPVLKETVRELLTKIEMKK